MQFISTRGQAPQTSFSDVLLAGLAPDGGLYLPQSWPQFSPGEIAAFKGQRYQDVAFTILSKFTTGSFRDAELREAIEAAYADFDAPEIAPLVDIGGGQYLLELFHGPTLAFKDIALQILGQLFSRALAKRGGRATIVAATSGDTGSAAIAALGGLPNINVFVMHPKGRVSDVQRLQMTTSAHANVHNIAIEGSFDDCQDLVKAMFNDATFRNDMHLSAVNSINWARILAQVVYYIYAGSRIFHQTKKKVVFSVPTGNFGNIYAGYIAQSMGLPVERLIAATNRNDILHRFFSTGRMNMEPSAASLSPSMDIQVSSNFERLLFDVFGRQGAAVAQTMEHFRKPAPFVIQEAGMTPLRELFASGAVSDDNTLKTIRDIHDKYGYVVDPHTAVGLAVSQKYREAYPDSVVVSLATAHPAKFPDAVKKAIGITPELPPHMADLFTREERCATLPNNLEWVQKFVRDGVKGK